MAIYHLSLQNISRRDGRNVVAAAAYRAGDRLRDERSGRVANYRNKPHVAHTALLVPSEGSGWVRGREQLWNAVEMAERRSDARLAKEVNVALPVELSKTDQIALAEAYGQWFVARGLIVDVAVHHLESHNPHFHILMTTREVTAEGFGKKHRWLDDKAFVVECRKAWTDICNAWLGKGGRGERIDDRTLSAQGIERRPTVHRGVRAEQLAQRGIPPRSAVRTKRSFWGNEREIDYRQIDDGRSRADYNDSLRDDRAQLMERYRQMWDEERPDRDWERSR